MSIYVRVVSMVRRVASLKPHPWYNLVDGTRLDDGVALQLSVAKIHNKKSSLTGCHRV